MNRICKQYLREIKALFPIKQKPEKEYLKKLLANVDDYCEDANVATKQDLYDNYGTPAEVAGNYITSMDTDVLMKRLKVSRSVRVCIVTLIAAIIVSIGAYCLNQYLMQKSWDYSQDNIIVKDTIIIDKTKDK